MNAKINSSKKTILIIEDDPVLSKMYREKFAFEGFEVSIARDGEEGLKVATSQKADIIILDIMLPRMSGTELLEKLRQSRQGKDVPVIVLTNLAEDEEKEKVLALGVKDYLIKATQTPDDVVEKVKKHLS